MYIYLKIGILEKKDQKTKTESTNNNEYRSGKDISIKELSQIIAKAINYEGSIVWDKSKPDGHPKKTT